MWNVEKFNQAAGIKDAACASLAERFERRYDRERDSDALHLLFGAHLSCPAPHSRRHTRCAGREYRAALNLAPGGTDNRGGEIGQEFDFPIWYEIWVPAGAPTGVVDKLANDIGRVLAGPDLRELIAKHGGEPMGVTQPEFVRFVESESEVAARLIETAR